MEQQPDAVALGDVLADTGAMAALRQAGPIHQVLLPTGAPAWLVVRHQEVMAALTDTRLSVAGLRESGALDGGKLRPEQRDALIRGLTNVDPPDHTRLRKLVSGAFTPRRIEGLRPRIGRLVDDLVAGFADRGRVELMAEFATPLPMLAIFELLGVPEADRQPFSAWSRDTLAGLGTLDFPVDTAEQVIAYLRDLTAEKRRRPDDGLLSAMIQARDEQDELSEDELTSMAFLMIVAGQETTASLVGTAMFLLTTQTDLAGRLRADPGLLPGAIEEFLRLEAPIPVATVRAAADRLDIGGTAVAPGEIVVLGLQSANRDESRFPNADRFDLDRSAGRHMSFGHSIHYCLGAPLARLESELAVGTLLRRFPDLRLAVPAAELTWSEGMFIHRLETLPLVFG
ncbi:MAG: cytochrome P450 [Catenulispora sp.]